MTVCGRVLQASFEEFDAPTLYAVLRLRVDVFVVEQGCPYPEIDGRDDEPGTVHLWIPGAAVPLGYLRILTDGPRLRRIGRVVVAREHRGTGLADELMRCAIELLGSDACVLDAQSPLVGFYRNFGFEVSGAEFLEDGIPHTPMARAGR